MNKKTAIIAAAAGVLVLAGGGTALAATSSIPDSGGVIHGCYHPQTDGHNSALSVIDTALSNGRCPTDQTEVDWNQQGPAGPAGPAGPQGPTGPSSAGSGLGVEYVNAIFTNEDQNGDINGFVICPADHPYVLGGGASVNAPNYLSTSEAFNQGGVNSSPEGPGSNGWGATAVVVPPLSGHLAITAICAK